MNRTLEVLREVLRASGRLPVYAVGGFLRDCVRKAPSPDVDLAVPGDPARLARRTAALTGGTAFPLDEERGIHRVQLRNGLRIDFARLRGRSLEEDLLARDFTINAMGLKLERPVLARLGRGRPLALTDPAGGLKDLPLRTLRAVSPGVFRDDPLRLLRAFRIASDLDFTIAPATLERIRLDRRRLRSVAGERIREEFLKLLAAPRGFRHVRSMDRAGLLKVLFPESAAMERTGHSYYGRGGVWKHSLQALEILEEVLVRPGRLFPRCGSGLERYLAQPVAGHPRSALLKAAELLHDVGKPRTARVIGGRLRFFGHEDVGAVLSRKILGRLRFSSEEQARVSKIVQAHMRPGNLAAQPVVTEKALFRFFRDLGDDAVGALLVSLADHLTYVGPRQRFKGKTPHERLTRRMIRRAFLEPAKVAPHPLVDGHDVMKTLKLPPGPLVGRILSTAREEQAAGHLKTRRDTLDWICRRFKAKLGREV